jgi:hypothetical protein
MAKRWEGQMEKDRWKRTDGKGQMGRRDGKKTKEFYVNPRNGTEYEGWTTNLNRLHQSQFVHEHDHHAAEPQRQGA